MYQLTSEVLEVGCIVNIVAKTNNGARIQDTYGTTQKVLDIIDREGYTFMVLQSFKTDTRWPLEINGKNLDVIIIGKF